MKLNRISYALIIGLAGSIALAGCKKKEEAATPPPPTATEPAPAPAPAEPAPAPAGVTVSSVTVGNTAAADKSVAPMATLAPTDKIIVSVKTDGTATNANVDAKLTYQDGQTAGQQSATLNTTGSETTNIEFTKATPWPAGKYKVDVTVNGQPAGTTQEIEIK